MGLMGKSEGQIRSMGGLMKDELYRKVRQNDVREKQIINYLRRRKQRRRTEKGFGKESRN